MNPTASARIIGGPGECFGEEQDVWVGVAWICLSTSSQKRTVWCAGYRLREDPNAAIPESNDSNNLIDEALGSPSEPDR